MKISNNENIETLAAFRQKCSCLEEYVIKRDLEFGFSRFECMFDFIAFVEKYPRLCFCLDMNSGNGSVGLFIINLLALVFTFFMMAFATMFFPYAYIDDNMFVATFIFDFIGTALIILALSIKVSDAKYELKINEL